MSDGSLHDREWIAARLPHSGAMCLLDGVHAWDARHICCFSRSHRLTAHPMRAGGRLGAACAAEYAAQAMALHGALREGGATAAPTPRPGMLVALRALRLHVIDLDRCESPLSIACARLDGDARTQLYDFDVRSGTTRIACGRATLLAELPS